MAVDMELIKKLREATFAPLKDCKEALMETNGDLDAAIEWLKKKGAAQAAKKADRETKEGAIKTLIKDNKIYAVKIATETDFVVKNEFFGKLTDDLLNAVSKCDKNVNNIEELPEEIQKETESLVHEFVGKIGENTKLADVYIHDIPVKAFVYTHPGDKIVSIVYYSSDDVNAETTAKQVALQVAAMNPDYLSLDAVPAEAKDEIKKQLTEEVAASGKPADIVEKIVAGKFEKAFEDTVLLEQPAIRNDSQKVKEAASTITISEFARISIGS